MMANFFKATLEDIPLLIELNNKAYKSDFMRYGECPGYQITEAKMALSIKQPEIQKYLIYVEKQPVGAISLKTISMSELYLGNLVIIPEYQNQGLGAQAIDFIWKEFPYLLKLTLVTPADKVENIHFYTKKCGFHITGKKMDGSVEVVDLCYEK